MTLDFDLVLIGSIILALGAGVMLPFLFRIVVPFFSDQARLRVYLRIIQKAAEPHQIDFGKAFDDPQQSWQAYSDKVLSLVSAKHHLPASDPIVEVAEKCFRNFGFVYPDNVELEH